MGGQRAKLRVAELRPGDKFRISSPSLYAQGTVRRILRVNVEYEAVYDMPSVKRVYTLRLDKRAFVGARVLRDGVVYEVI